MTMIATNATPSSRSHVKSQLLRPRTIAALRGICGFSKTAAVRKHWRKNGTGQRANANYLPTIRRKSHVERNAITN